MTCRQLPTGGLHSSPTAPQSYLCMLLQLGNSVGCQQLVHNVDSSNFSGFTMTAPCPVFPPPTFLVWASTTSSCISNFLCATLKLQQFASMSSQLYILLCHLKLITDLMKIQGLLLNHHHHALNCLSSRSVTASSNSLWAVFMSLISLFNSFW